MTPTQMHGRLDEKGLLDDAHSPGTYAIAVETPDDVESVARAWLQEVDAPLSDKAFERLSNSKVCYVGASKDVYNRLQDHAEASVRKALFLRVFAPVDVVGVWPSDSPFRDEYSKALELSGEGWVAWSDGTLL
ncbi:GIY-YIG nuclease [Haloferax tailed virus 1]|uniref:GIY-YIG nuclease n=1 Tax=Haloferax tailed virus 1 TaxID=2507575 RepID=A0A410N6Z1_HFTV1|nr:GIY-YIG nuclease [Haloferax tailed virus 1]QAS68900.1 GIY-YIG nuclease [Haloferax tailed virus 1]